MAASTPADAVLEPADRVLVLTRIIDAPRDLVFRAWSEPEQMRRWAGPRGFTATHVEQDGRPGGAWRLCLREDATGRELWQGGVFREIVPPERLVFTFAWDQEDGTRGPETLVTITFAEHAGRTTMVFRQAVFNTQANRDGHQGGWSSAFDRLEELVARKRAA